MLKRMALGAALVATAALLAWSGGVLLYGLRVRRAVDHLRQEHLHSTAPGSYQEIARARSLSSVEEVVRLGCRALPALMAELDPAVSPYYLCRVADCVTDISDGEAPRVVFEDEPEQRAKSVDALRAWWREKGGELHQPWRFWTSRCRVLVK